MRGTLQEMVDQVTYLETIHFVDKQVKHMNAIVTETNDRLFFNAK